jgi:hypothetical protein
MLLVRGGIMQMLLLLHREDLSVPFNFVFVCTERENTQRERTETERHAHRQTEKEKGGQRDRQ